MSVDFNSDKYKAYYEDQAKDALSSGYDKDYLTWMETVLTPHEVDKFEKIVDVGCRSFDGYEWWKEVYKKQALGIDIGREGLEYCKEHNKPCMEVDAHVITDFFDNDSIDLLTAFHSLEHMYDLDHVLKEMYKVLKPGGYLCLSVPIPSYNWGRGHWADIPDCANMEERLTKTGYQIIKTRHLQNNEIRPQPELLAIVRKP